MRDYQIIAVDFDGTLCYSSWPELGEPNTPLIEQLKQLQKDGNKIILWTCLFIVYLKYQLLQRAIPKVA